MSVPLVTCWEKADLKALLYVMFSCVFVTLQCGILGQVWYFIVSIPDIFLLTYSFYLLFFFINNKHYCNHKLAL